MSIKESSEKCKLPLVDLNGNVQSRRSNRQRSRTFGANRAVRLSEDLLSDCVYFFTLYTNASLGLTSLKNIINDPSYTQFAAKTADLKLVDPTILNPHQLTTFWLNIHNLLVLHTHIERIELFIEAESILQSTSLLSGDSKLERVAVQYVKSFLDIISTTRYVFFNGVTLNALDIEFSILRAKSFPADSGPFAASRFRQALLSAHNVPDEWQCQHPEPMVSFLITYLTQSSPPLIICRYDTVRETFQLATRLFLENSVKIRRNDEPQRRRRSSPWLSTAIEKSHKESSKQRTRGGSIASSVELPPKRYGSLVLPTVLKWYTSDFGATQAEEVSLLQWVFAHVGQAKADEIDVFLEDMAIAGRNVKVEFDDYNWRFNYTFMPTEDNRHVVRRRSHSVDRHSRRKKKKKGIMAPTPPATPAHPDEQHTPTPLLSPVGDAMPHTVSSSHDSIRTTSSSGGTHSDDDDDDDADDDDSGHSGRHASRAHSSPFTATLKPQQSTSSTTTHALNTSIESIPSPPRSHERHEELTNAAVDVPPPDRSSLLTARKKPPAKLATTKSDPYAEVRRLARLEKSSLRSSAKKAARATCTSGQFASSATYSSDDRRMSTDDSDSDSSLNRHKRTASAGGLEEILKKLPMPSSPIPVSSDGGSQRRRTSQFLSSSLGEQKEEELWRRFSAPVSFILPPELRGDNNYDEVIVSPLSAGGSVERTHAFNKSPDVHQLSPGTMLPRSEPRAVAQGVDVMAERRRQNRDLFTSSAPIPFAPMNNNKGRNRTSSVVEEQYAFAARQALAKSTGGLTPPAFANDRKFMTMTVGSMPRSFGTRPRAGSRTNVDVRRMVQQRDATMPLSASPSFLPASFGGRHRRNTDNPRRIIPQTRRQSKSDRPKDSPKRVELMRRSQSKPADWTPKVLPRAESDRTVHFDRVWYTTSQTHSRHNSLHRSDSLTDELSKTAATDTRAIQIAALKRAQEKLTNMLKKARVRAKHSQLLNTAKRPSFSATQPIPSPSATAPVPKRTRSPSVSSALKTPDKQVKSVVFSSSAPGEILTKSNETQKSLESGQSQESSTASTASARRRKRLLKRRTSAPEHQSMTKLSTGIDYEMLTHELRSMKERSNIDIDLIIDELKVKIEHADATHRLIYESFKDLCREYYETSADAYVVHHDRFRSLLHRLQQKAAPNDDPVNRVVARLLFVLSPIGRLLRLLALRGPGMTEAERRRAREARRVSVAAMSNNAPPPELDSNGELASGDMDMCFESMSSDERGLDSSEEASTGRARAYSAGHTLNSAEQMAMLEDSPEHDTILSTSVSAMQPETMLPLVCRICDERMLATAGNFELHTTLCAEAQQIADNIEASTDERIVLLMRHVKRCLPQSRQRNKALPILNHLQDAAINCRYGDEAAAEKLQALVEQLRTLLSETVEEKLALYTFGSRILALMEEKSEALSQVAQAARDGRSIWGVLSLLPSTDAVAPPPAARSKSLMSLNFNPDDSDATETDDADTDDKQSTNEPSPRLPPNAPQPHERSDSKRSDSPFGKRNSEPHGSPLNLSRLPQSGKFRKPGSALSSPRMGSPRVSSPRKGPSIEDFTLIKPISAGGFGKVFLGKKNTTGDIYAIKVIYKSSLMRKNLVDQAIAERNIMAATDNPFVVKLFFAFESETKLYFVMEYVIGGDCASLLNALGCFDIEMSKRYIAETTLALRYLHSLGVIHRDLKPDNMLINENGHIVLTDFGLSEVGVIEQQDSAPPSLLNVSARKTSVSSPSLPTSPADARQLVRAVSSSVLPPTSPASRRLAASGVRGSPLRKSTSLRAGHQPLASSDTDVTHQSNDTNNDNDNAQNDDNNNSVFESNDFVKLNVSDGCRKSPRKVVVFSVHEPIVLTTRGETMLFDPNVSSSASTTPSDTPRDGARRSFSARTSNLGASVEYGASTDDSGATQRDSSGDRKDSDAFDANAGLFALDDEGHEERKASSDTLTASGLKRSTSSEVMSPTDRIQQLNLSGSLNQSMKLSRSALSQLPMDDGSPNNDEDDDDDIELTNRGERRSSTLRVAASSQDVSRHLSNSRDDESGGSVVIHDNVDDNTDDDEEVESSSGSIDLLDGGNRRILRTTSYSTINTLEEENDNDDDDDNDDDNGESKSDDNDGDDERESDDERGSEDASAFTSGSSVHGRVNTSATSSSTTSTSSTSGSDDETVSFISRRKSARPATHRIRGTPDYLAPEIVLGSEHAAPVDWWALGVILFEFLVGIPPFNADTREAIQERILSRHVPWDDLPDDECDEHTMDLLRRLLTYSPEHRLGANGAEEIMAHPFFKGTDWDTLYSRHDDVPFTPAPSDDLDTSYFIPRAGQMSMSLDTASAAKPLKVPRFRGALDEDVDRRAARHKLDDGENDDNDVTDQDENGNNMSQLSPASRRQLALFGRTFSFTNVSNLSQKNKESAKSIHRSLKLQKASLAMSQSSLKSGEFSPRLSPRSGNNSPRDTSPRVTASNSVQISPRSEAGTSSLAHSSPSITPAASPGIAAPSPKLDRLSRAPSSLRASARRSTMEESDSCSEDNTSTQSQSLLSTSDKLTHKSSLAAQSFKHSPSDNESSSPRSNSNTPGRASLTTSSSTPRPNVK